jgi:peptidoglycan-N-acetylglucosamine deacetylase
MASLLVATVRGLLPIINKVHARALRIKPLGEQSVICIEVRRHKGRPIRLEDGCEVNPGDRVIRLHFNNTWIVRRRRSNSGTGRQDFPRGFVNDAKDGLRILAREAADGEYGDIVAVYGWTALYNQARRLGFQIIELPDSLRIRLARLHIVALMQSHQMPWLRRHASSGKSVEVKEVWLSRARLLRIYGAVS